MTVIVDHDLRRTLILEKAFELFSEEGYSGATFQKIADRCGISRTSIYKYFPNKERIFDYAIKQGSSKLNAMIEKVIERKDWTATDKITRILHITSKVLSENRVFLSVVLEYILSQKHAGANVRRKVRKHTFGMKFVLRRLLIEANAMGELNIPDPVIAVSHLYGMLESFVLNLTVTDILKWKDVLAMIDAYLSRARNIDR